MPPARKTPAAGRVGPAGTKRRFRPFSEAEARTWYVGKAVGYDWTSWHFPTWAKLLRAYREKPALVIEIGSWEGRSALFFLNYMPRCRVTCIDTFAGGEEHRAADDAPEMLPQLEARFDANVAAFAKRVTKIKARSTDALAELGVARKQFDWPISTAATARQTFTRTAC